MEQTIIRTETFERMHCESCGVVFFVPKPFKDGALNSGSTWYCPTGHQWHFSETTESKLRRQVANLEQRATSLSTRIEELRESRNHVERRLSAQKAATHRIKNRVRDGKCLCCSKNFADLAAHMKAEHPGFASDEPRR